MENYEVMVTYRDIAWGVTGLLIGGLTVAYLFPLSASLMSIFSPEDVALENTENSDNGKTDTQGAPGRFEGGITAGIIADAEGVVVSSASARVSNQPAGKAVVVSGVDLPQESWIVVHEVIAGHIANALGAALRPSGMHENVIVDLLRQTEPENQYAIVLYADNGNRTFELRTDQPILNRDGDPIIRTFTAQIPLKPAGE